MHSWLISILLSRNRLRSLPGEAHVRTFYFCKFPTVLVVSYLFSFFISIFCFPDFPKLVKLRRKKKYVGKRPSNYVNDAFPSLSSFSHQFWKLLQTDASPPCVFNPASSPTLRLQLVARTNTTVGVSKLWCWPPRYGILIMFEYVFYATVQQVRPLA